LAALIAALALRAHALDRSGALAAIVVGALTYGVGGWPFTLVLLAFFVPSVALSRVGRARKKRLVDIGKGGPRDAWQVLANGGVATACAVGSGFSLSAAHPSGARLLMAGFAGAYAAATADTWGTEIGTLMRGLPRSILTGRPIPTGLSGGVTLWGSLAEIAGAGWIGLSTHGLPALAMQPARANLFLPVALGGAAGALIDSLLGATVQELRRCPACERTCETNPHACGTPTALIRGMPGFSNDLVNFGATLGGALTALLLAATW
jgi:uncharacterized protein (TIGR00297 family)